MGSTIGFVDDVGDGSGISESSDVCYQTTDPMSHTLVSRKCYAFNWRPSSTNPMVDPFLFCFLFLPFFFNPTPAQAKNKTDTRRCPFCFTVLDQLTLNQNLWVIPREKALGSRPAAAGARPSP